MRINILLLKKDAVRIFKCLVILGQVFPMRRPFLYYSFWHVIQVQEEDLIENGFVPRDE